MYACNAVLYSSTSNTFLEIFSSVCGPCPVGVIRGSGSLVTESTGPEAGVVGHPEVGSAETAGPPVGAEVLAISVCAEDAAVATCPPAESGRVPHEKTAPGTATRSDVAAVVEGGRVVGANWKRQSGSQSDKCDLS